MRQQRYIEKGIAIASFATAVALSFTSLLISADHDITANVLLAIAQFLTLCATILGIDYKFTSPSRYDTNQTTRNPE